MRRRPTFRVIAAFAMIVIIAGLGLFIVTLGDTAKLSETASLGPSPTLPEPTKSLVPTVNIAYAEGWPEGGKPIPASGLEVNAFATGLDHPRWLYVLPNGDVLVAESNAPADRPEEGKGVKGKVYQEVQSLAGAGVPSADRTRFCATIRTAGPPNPSFFRVFIPPSAWRWSATTSTSPIPTLSCAFLTPKEARRSRLPASRSPTCQGARSTIIG
jgi:hypothetical protein